ncbi:hypothetical protein D9M72_329860 [compost metagenome]
MAVAHGRIGQENLVLATHPFGELLRAEFVELLLGTGGDVPFDERHGRLCCVGRRARTALCFRVAVDGDVGEIGQELRRTVLAPHLLEQFRRRVDEARRIAVILELRMADDRLEKGQVGCHTADAELPQRAVHAADRFEGVRRPGGNLDEQWVVEAGNDCTRIGGAAIETDAEAGRRAITGDAAIVRNEVLLRVFGGDAALQRVTVEADVFLRGNARFRRAYGVTVEDVDLRLDDVDASHDFRDGVLHLNARVDLDEVELAGVGIHQILDRAGADIARRTGDHQRIVGKLLALRIREVGRRRALDDLLVAALDRAVALEEMHDIAVGIAEDLAFDVAGAFDELFEIDLVLAEGGLGLALGFGHLADQVFRVANGAHAASATAPGGLEHDRIADLGGEAMDFLFVLRQRIGGRHDRHADGDGEIARGNLVAELAHRRRARTDEDDAGGIAGIDEFGAFRKQAVTRMDGIGAGEPGDADHLVDRQVALDRTEVAGKVRTAADLITFVRLEAVQSQFIFFRPYRDRIQTEFVCSAENADGNFRTVGNKDLRDRQVGLLNDLILREMLHPRNKVLASHRAERNFRCDRKPKAFDSRRSARAGRRSPRRDGGSCPSISPGCRSYTSRPYGSRYRAPCLCRSKSCRRRDS